MAAHNTLTVAVLVQPRYPQPVGYIRQTFTSFLKNRLRHLTAIITFLEITEEENLMSLSIKLYNYKCLVYGGVKERFLAWLITKIRWFESILRAQTLVEIYLSFLITPPFKTV